MSLRFPNPVNVLFFSRRYFPTISGMSAYAQNLLGELVRRGHGVAMLSQFRADAAGAGVYGDGPPPAVPGVRVLGRPSAGEADGGDFERDVDDLVARALDLHAETPFDVFHAQYGYPTGYAALVAAARAGVPCVVSIQGGDGHWVGACCGRHRRAMRAVLDGANALVIGSRSFADSVDARLGPPRTPWYAVPGAVDTARYHPADGAEPGALRHRPPVVLYHGRVDRRKGVLDLLDAWPRVRADARLVVSGVGPDAGAVRERARGMERVEVTGYVDYDATPAIYRAADVFVSPTYAEGFSNTILEAMATGLPIVSTRAVGVVDCLRDADEHADGNALLVSPGDVPALAAAIERMLTDGALRARLASAALAEVHERYAWTVIAGEIERVYASVAGARPHAFAPIPPAGVPPTDLGEDERGPDATPDGAACRFRAAPHLL